MADYVFEVPLTEEGGNVIDPDILDSVISEGAYMIPGVTYNNLSVDTVDFDAETKRIYYGVNASPQMKAGLVSLNTVERLAWYDTLLAGVAVAGAIVCVIVGAPVVVPIGLVIVAGVALARESITGFVEAEVTKAKTKEKIVELTGTPGNPFYDDPDLAKDYLDSVDKSWASDITEAIKWMAILVGGAIALQMILPIITQMGKKGA